MATLWHQRYAQRTQRMHSSAIRELLKWTEQPDVISFAGGLPAAETFPIAEFQEACEMVLAEHGAQALQYGATEGYRPLREMIARHTARYGMHVTVDNILITSGSQQALDLMGKVFLNPGDHVLVEQPTYLGALQAWNSYQAEYLTVPLDADGLCPAPLAEALRAGPKFLYVLPNFHNPAGVTLARERRMQVVALAEQYGVPILEDDPYGQLRYEGEHLPTLLGLAAQAQAEADTPYHGDVIYLSTFSKTLAPGLRLGWVVAPIDVIQRLVQAKQGCDLHTSMLVQMVAYEVARGGFLDQHVREVRELYRARRDAMLAALRQHFPPGITWTEPQGGLFLWVTLPEQLNAAELLPAALAANVAFVPGAAFFAQGGGHHTLRLNFSCMPPERIAEGIQRLGEVIAQGLRQG